MARSATSGVGARSKQVSSSTGSRACWVAVRSTLVRTCQVSAPARVRLPPQLLRVTTAGADGLFGAPVGGLHAGQAQEPEQVLAFAGEVVEQPAVGWVAGGPGHQLVELRAEAVGLAGQGGPIQGARVVGVAERERMRKDAAYRVRGADLPAVGVGEQLQAASQQVRKAALVARVGEAAVRRPAVAFQHSGVALAETWAASGSTPPSVVSGFAVLRCGESAT
jgi:hypothetical protein